jgi:hypothetical protein
MFAHEKTVSPQNRLLFDTGPLPRRVQALHNVVMRTNKLRNFTKMLRHPIGDRCYDTILANFRRKNWLFSQKPTLCMINFCKNRNSLCKKRNNFRQIFRRIF